MTATRLHFALRSSEAAMTGFVPRINGTFQTRTPDAQTDLSILSMTDGNRTCLRTTLLGSLPRTADNRRASFHRFSVSRPSKNLTMKFAALIFSLVTVSTSAFLTPAPMSSSKVALSAASGMFGPHGPRLGQDSTKPVADRKVSAGEKSRMKDAVLDPDYRLAIWFACLCPLILWYHPCA